MDLSEELLLFTLYIPSLFIKFSNNVPLSASSFITECFAILEAFLPLKLYVLGKFFICSDSQSCLMSLISSPLSSDVSYLVLLGYVLSCSGITIIFLWVPSYIGILGNVIMNHLIMLCSFFILFSIKIPFSDFLPVLVAYTFKSWNCYWANLFISAYSTA